MQEFNYLCNSSVSFVNFEQISNIALVFLLLTLNKCCLGCVCFAKRLLVSILPQLYLPFDVFINFGKLR